MYDKRLRETYLGKIENKTKEEVEDLEKQMGFDEGDLLTTRKVHLVGGESIPDREERVGKFFKEQILKHTESREE